jgi:hypothetical protein
LVNEVVKSYNNEELYEALPSGTTFSINYGHHTMRHASYENF